MDVSSALHALRCKLDRLRGDEDWLIVGLVMNFDSGQEPVGSVSKEYVGASGLRNRELGQSLLWVRIWVRVWVLRVPPA